MLTDSFKELIYQIFEEKSVTTRTQKIWTNSLSFYLAVRDLQDMGLIDYRMIDGRSKAWALTDKGKTIVLLHIKLDSLQKEFDEVLNNDKTGD